MTIAMSYQARELYASPNRDYWYLVREIGSGRVFVRHSENAPSGGRMTDIDLTDFLAIDHCGPEHQALRRLIGDLVEGRPAGKKASVWED
jgi:hypothetical protein